MSAYRSDVGLEARSRMVETQIAARGVADERVLAAMRAVPRELFAPRGGGIDAFGDGPLPIGHGATLSQPYIVALMTELARPQPRDRALDIGAGSGYQSAVLARLCASVDAVEIVPELCELARRNLAAAGVTRVTLHCRDGRFGLPDAAPFDVIIVAAAPEEVPSALIEQLAPGGRMVIPIGPALLGWADAQELLLVEKRADGSVLRRSVCGVRVVPLV
ncbi:MAG: protein-L-isoaspartate(D-aspartate) O-methyltransferase [Myxococcota bacterium]